MQQTQHGSHRTLNAWISRIWRELHAYSAFLDRKCRIISIGTKAASNPSKKKPKLIPLTKTIFYGLMAAILVIATASARAQYQPGEQVWTLPAHGVYFSMQRTNFPPLPVLSLDVPVYFLDQPTNGMPRFLFDDRDVDYSELQSLSMSELSEESTESESTFSYGPNDLYLTIDLDTNLSNYVDLVLHGATNGYWQLLNRTDLTNPPPGSFGEILYDDGTTNELFYTPLADDVPPIQFFRAVGGDTVVSLKLDHYFYTPAEPCSPTGIGQTGIFEVDVNPTVPRNLTVVYTIGGSASNGVDYTNITGSVIIPANTSVGNIYIQPLYDTLLEFDESVTLTLVLTNGYVADPNNYTATEWISDCISNEFTIVATNLPAPIGIDYFSPSNSLVLSWNYDFGETNNFILFNTNHFITNWSRIHGVPDEVKIATVKRTVNAFTNGDMYFSSGTNIGWLSVDGMRSNLTFCVLTNAVVTNAQFLRGSLYVDQTGVWSNQLIAVTSDSTESSDAKGIWRIDSQGHPTLVTLLRTSHLEGVATVTNDVAKWGPWAGKIITGDENKHTIYAIDTNGVVASFSLGIDTEDVDIIPPNQDLYCVLYNGFDSSLIKVSHSLFTNYVGSLLITQAGETAPFFSPSLFIVTWTGTAFDVRKITFHSTTVFGDFEHVTFAPIDIPGL